MITMINKLYFIMIIFVMLLVGCSGSVDYDTTHNVNCQDKCVQNNMTLEYVVHSNNGYICNCQKRFEIQEE